MLLTITTLSLLLSLSNTYPLPRISHQVDSLICTTNKDCGGNEVCTKTIGDKCADDTPCFCIAEGLIPKFDRCQEDKQCKSNACIVGICLPPLDINIPGLNITTDTDGGITVTDPLEKDKNKETESGVCIAVHLLKGFHPNDLVFDKHRNANVLCDQFGSCATPGHIIYWKDQAMMMKTYCEQVHDGCRKKVMLVNSPRYGRKLRVESISPQLSFTAFAARWESVGEELFLRTAVRMGL